MKLFKYQVDVQQEGLGRENYKVLGEVIIDAPDIETARSLAQGYVDYIKSINKNVPVERIFVEVKSI